MTIGVRWLWLAATLLWVLWPGGRAGASDILPAPLPEVTPARAPAVLAFDKTSMYELRFGGFSHGIGAWEATPASVDVNVELVGPRLPITLPGASWINLAVPRPMIGVMANTRNKTSYAYLSAVWTLEYRNFFVEPIFGGAIHNGYSDNPPLGRNALGCNPLFLTGISVGYYVTDRWSIMGTWQHISNANTCVRNVGLNTYGVRLGYSFGPF